MSSSVFIDVTDLLFFVDLESFNACFYCVSSVLSFDLANHLNTAPELVDRVYNRPTLETLETKSIQGAVEPHNIKVCVCVMRVDQPRLLCDHPEASTMMQHL